jgi:hypothetical protein
MKTCADCGSATNEDGATACVDCGSNNFIDPNAPVSLPSIPPEIETEWVTVRRCENLPAADAVAMELRAAQIPVFMPHEFANQSLPLVPNVDVKVPADQLARAREILDSPDAKADAAPPTSS